MGEQKNRMRLAAARQVERDELTLRAMEHIRQQHNPARVKAAIDMLAPALASCVAADFVILGAQLIAHALATQDVAVRPGALVAVVGHIEGFLGTIDQARTVEQAEPAGNA